MTAQLADRSSAPRNAVADVDVVIVGYHSRDLVTACLDSLADDAELVSMTITVVDNGSADGTVEAVAAAVTVPTCSTSHTTRGSPPRPTSVSRGDLAVTCWC